MTFSQRYSGAEREGQSELCVVLGFAYDMLKGVLRDTAYVLTRNVEREEKYKAELEELFEFESEAEDMRDAERGAMEEVRAIQYAQCSTRNCLDETGT